MPEKTTAKPKPFFIVLPIVLLVYFSINVSYTLLQSVQNKQRLQDIQADVAQLSTRHDQLKKQLTVEQTDAFVEEQARNHLNMAKANETVVIFPRQQTVLGAVDMPIKGASAPSTYSNFNAWTKFFLN